jgi:hypothetical protein
MIFNFFNSPGYCFAPPGREEVSVSRIGANASMRHILYEFINRISIRFIFLVILEYEC